MKIDVTELRRGIGREATYELGETIQPVEMAGETIRFEPAHVILRLVSAGDTIEAYFHATSGAHMLCSRCLKPIVVPIDVEFMVSYQQAPDESKVDESSSDDVVFYHEDLVDVSEDLRQHLILELPMKPVCDPACKGLCPTCGKDLNNGECGCRETADDPRMSVLKDLLKRE